MTLVELVIRGLFSSFSPTDRPPVPVAARHGSGLGLTPPSQSRAFSGASPLCATHLMREPGKGADCDGCRAAGLARPAVSLPARARGRPRHKRCAAQGRPNRRFRRNRRRAGPLRRTVGGCAAGGGGEKDARDPEARQAEGREGRQGPGGATDGGARRAAGRARGAASGPEARMTWREGRHRARRQEGPGETARAGATRLSLRPARREPQRRRPRALARRASRRRG